MSIWGSVLGGMVGFSFGGPIGALIGSMIGGRLSSSRRGGFRQSFAQQQQIFIISLIILTAKLAKVDGHVSKEELVAVKEKLKIPEREIDQVGKIFNKAKEDSLGYEPYAKQEYISISKVHLFIRIILLYIQNINMKSSIGVSISLLQRVWKRYQKWLFC